MPSKEKVKDFLLRKYGSNLRGWRFADSLNFPITVDLKQGTVEVPVAEFLDWLNK